MNEPLILAVNPGSTSTKLALYRGRSSVFEKSLKHCAEELAVYPRISDQYEFRKNLVLAALHEAAESKGFRVQEIRAVVGRGGLIKSVPSGVYEVNEAMKRDLRAGLQGEHASNLGGLIADDLRSALPDARAFIADPVVVDELEPAARLSGHPLFERRSIFHALNQKAIGRLHAEAAGSSYESLNLIVAHLGGGISVGAHRRGLVIDVNQALDGEGPFSPERSGTLPAGDIVRLCFSGRYSEAEVRKMLTSGGGYTAYLGTNDAAEVERRAAAGDERAALVRRALIHQVAKDIGAMSTVLAGRVDGILITGGMAFNSGLVEELASRIRHLGTVYVYPGEDELKALAMNGLRVLEGGAEALEYR